MGVKVTDRERLLGEAFAAYIMAQAAMHWGMMLNEAVRVNLNHPDANILGVAQDGLIVAGQRSNRWLKRAVERAGGGFDDLTLRRITFILDDLRRRYLGLSEN